MFQEEQQFQQEHINDPFDVSAKSFSDVGDEDVSLVKQFMSHESSLIDEFRRDHDPNSPEMKARVSSQMTTIYFGLSPLLKREGKKGYLVTASEDSDKLLGFGIINYIPENNDPRKVSLYFGRASDAPGRGIGINILRKQIEVLRALGIGSYISNVNKDSKKIYERLGLKTEILEEGAGSTKLLVTLS